MRSIRRSYICRLQFMFVYDHSRQQKKINDTIENMRCNATLVHLAIVSCDDYYMSNMLLFYNICEASLTKLDWVLDGHKKKYLTGNALFFKNNNNVIVRCIKSRRNGREKTRNNNTTTTTFATANVIYLSFRECHTCPQFL